MRFRGIFLLGLFLAGVAVSAGADTNPAVQMRVSGRTLTIAGSGWQLTYGTVPERGVPPAELLPAASGKLWFRHGSWLRLIDTSNGNVAGRWRLPGIPIKLSPGKSSASVEIEYAERGSAVRRKSELDAEAPPRAHYLAANDPYTSRLSACEAQNLLVPGVVSGDCMVQARRLEATAAKAGIVRLEEIARHDTLSPWIQVSLAKLLREVGDPRAQEVFSRALRISNTDFSELFSISAFLDQIEEPELAQEAYDRGCADFLKRGNIPWLAAYAPYFRYGGARERHLEEREYTLAPGSYFRQTEWLSAAEQAEKAGRLEEARLWRARAQEASERSFNALRGGVWFVTNQLLFVLLAAIAGAFGYLAFLYARHLPEKGADGNRLFPLLCTSGAQRAAFLLIVIAAWLSAGFACAMFAGARRFAAMPMPLGSLTGAAMREYLKKMMAAMKSSKGG